MAEKKHVFCYFGSWSKYRPGDGRFDVEDIDPHLCTHAAFGFAGLDKNTFEIKVLDPYNELEENYGRGAYRRFTNMKNESQRQYQQITVFKSGTSSA